MRRIKNVSLSIPCVVGPYSGVHARLTLLSSTIRLHPELMGPARGCCPDEPDAEICCRECHECPDSGCRCVSGDCGEPEPHGYELLPDDPRAVRDYAAREAIATSSGQTDSGLFEVNFRDERYLPFELHGAVSRWRLELPAETNQFPIMGVSDVVMHLAFMAREGGEPLRRAALRQAQTHLPGDGLCLIDVAHDMPDAWYALERPDPQGVRRLPVRLSRTMFPFVPGSKHLRVTSIGFLIEAPCAVPSRHHLVRYYPHRPDHHERFEFEEFECIASVEWPSLYHGVLEDVGRGRIPDREETLGTVTLPEAVDRISRLWLICGYTTTCA